jgi:protein O-GlcNAc transferase
MSKLKKHVDILFSEAQEHHHARRFAEAKKIYIQILEVIPEHPDVLNLLGTAVAQSGKSKEAIGYLHRAVNLRPDLALFRVNLGVILQDLHEFDRAKECYEKAINIDVGLADAYYNLAKLYKQMGNLDAALITYEHLLSFRPERQDALVNLGNIHFDNGALENAIVCFQKALLVNSNDKQLTDQAKINLANTYRRQGEDVKAIETYEQVLAREFRAGLRIKQAMTLPVVYRDHLQINDIRDRLKEELAEISSANLVVLDPALEVASTNFFLAYQAKSNRVLQEKTAELMLNACPALNFSAPHCESSTYRGGKIKIGFISAYFRRHSIGRLMRGLIENLSKQEFEITVLIPSIHDDPVARGIQDVADKVIVFPDDTFEAQGIIAAQKLDILYYADLGMDIRTYFLAFARLARVQCVTWGHPDTSGIPNMDYFISGDVIEPEEGEQHYSEELYRLSTIPTYYYPIEMPTDLKKNKSQFGCPSEMTLYLCPQSAIKHHPDLDFIFGEILKVDKGALIMVVEGAVNDWSTQVRERWKKTIPRLHSNIKIIKRQSPENFIALQNTADIILDTPHFSGGNTSLEAFALGKPVVTFEGEFMRGRVTAGMYRMMGIDTCIAKNLNEYVEIALKLGLDKAYREGLSRRIKLSNKVLYENTEVINEFETFFKSVFSMD